MALVPKSDCRVIIELRGQRLQRLVQPTEVEANNQISLFMWRHIGAASDSSIDNADGNPFCL